MFIAKFKAVQHQRPPRSHQIKREATPQTENRSTPPTNKRLLANATSPYGSQFYSQRYSPYAMTNHLPKPVINEQSAKNLQNFWNVLQQQQQQQQSQQTNNQQQIDHPNVNQNNYLTALAAFNFPQLLHLQQQQQQQQQQTKSAFRQVQDCSINTSGYSSGYGDDSSLSVTSSSEASKSSSSSTSAALMLKEEYEEEEIDCSGGGGGDDGGGDAMAKLASSRASLANIMDWIKSRPTDNWLDDVASKVLFAALRWAKTQTKFLSLPQSDQNALIVENLSELFILKMAETKSFMNECMEFFVVMQSIKYIP